MLTDNCFHEWLSPEGWITLNEINCTNARFWGGSSPRFMTYFPADNRTTLPFWGCDCEHKGGCNGTKWGNNFTMYYARGKKYTQQRNSQLQIKRK